MPLWFELDEGRKILALENKALTDKFPEIHPKAKIVTINDVKYIGYECTLTTKFEGKVKKLKVFIRYPKDYLHIVDTRENTIKVYPIEVLDVHDNPTGEILEKDGSHHRWQDDGRLCLFYTGEGGAVTRKVSIVTIIAWASTWWWCYNYMKKYGTWPAKEV
jgi:hypothetical protein